MRIVDVEATPLAIPLRTRFHWSGGQQEGANLVLFSVHTADGIIGYGESICEDPAAVVSYGLLLAKHFIGRELPGIEATLRSVWTQGRWRFWPQFTQLTLAGIEVACWDALGRTLGVPSRTFFGGAVREEVDFFGFAQGETPEELAGHARELADTGYEVIYLKVGRGVHQDEEAVAAVRAAIGPDRLLRIDPNEAWDVSSAIQQIRRLEAYELDWVEQPVPAGNVSGLAQVRRAVSTRIAADQAVFTVSQMLDVLEKEAADVIVHGPHDAGGLLRFRQQAYVCEAHGVSVNRHAFMETGVSFLASLQVAATIPNLTLGNQAMHQLLSETLVKEPQPVMPAGRARVPDGPGHGFEIDLDAVASAHERWRTDGPYPSEPLAAGSRGVPHELV